MPDSRIVVEVDPRKAKLGLRQIRQGLQQTQSAANSLRNTFARVFAFIGIGKAIATIADFGQAMSTVRAITQATEEQFQSLSDEAKRLGATTRFSATQAAEGLLFLARAGLDAGEALEAVEGTLKLAQAGNLELGRAADIATNALTGFGLEVIELARVVDVLALASNSANTDVNQLGEALKFVAPIAAGVGVTIEETTAAIAALADAGLQASIGGTGLRRVISELEAPAEKTIKLFNAFGVEAKDVKVSTVGLSTALKTLADAGLTTGDALEAFGDRGGPAFEVLKNSVASVREMTEELNNAAGTATRIAAVMDDNLRGALLSVRSALEALILGLAGLDKDSVFTKAVRALATLLRTLKDNAELVGKALVTFASVILAKKFVSGVRIADKALKAFIATSRVHLATIAVQVRSGAVLALSYKAIGAAIAASTVALKANLITLVLNSKALKAFRATLLAVVITQKAMAKGTFLLTAALEVARLKLLTTATALRVFKFALAATGIGLVVVALGTLAVALSGVADEAKIANDRLATFGDITEVTFGAAARGLQRISFDLVVLARDLIPNVFKDIDISIEGAIRVLARFGDSAIATITVIINGILEPFKLAFKAAKALTLVLLGEFDKAGRAFADIIDPERFKDNFTKPFKDAAAGLGPVESILNEILEAAELRAKFREEDLATMKRQAEELERQKKLEEQLVKLSKSFETVGAISGVRGLSDALDFLEFSIQDASSELEKMATGLAPFDEKVFDSLIDELEQLEIEAGVAEKELTKVLDRLASARALKDTKFLKAVVEPLQTEIDLLRESVRQRDIILTQRKAQEALGRELVSEEKELVSELLLERETLLILNSALQDTETASEKYEKQLETLEIALALGTLSMKEFGIAASALTDIFERTAPPDFSKLTKPLEDQIVLLRVVGAEREKLSIILRLQAQLNDNLSEAEKKTVGELVKEIRELTRLNELLGLVDNSTQKYLADQELLNREIAKGGPDVQKYIDALAALETQFNGTSDTIKTKTDDIVEDSQNLLEQLSDQYGNAAKDIEDVFVNAFGAISDKLAEFVLTGKASFEDLANSIARDLTRIAINQALLSGLSGLSGLFNPAAATTTIGAGNADLTFSPTTQLGPVGSRAEADPFASAATFTAAPSTPSVVNNISVTSNGGDDNELARQVAKEVTRAMDTSFKKNIRSAVQPGGQLNPRSSVVV